MNYKIINVCVTLMILFFIASCTKTFLEPKTNSTIRTEKSTRTVALNELNIQSGLTTETVQWLSFSSTAVYDSIMDDLDEQTDDHMSDFLNTLSNDISDELLNHIADSVNFDEDLPIKNFLDNYDFTTSKLEKYWDEESIVMNDTAGDFATLNADFPYLDSEMALQNKYGYLEINDTLIIQLNNGWISINNGDSSILISYHNGNDILNNPNVSYHIDISDYSDCKKNTAKSKDFYYSDKKAATTIFFRNNWFNGVYTKAKMKIYKRKSNGKWKRYKTNIGASTYSSIFNSYVCQHDFYTSDGWTYKRASSVKRKKKFTDPNFRRHSVSRDEGETYGYFRYQTYTYKKVYLD